MRPALLLRRVSDALVRVERLALMSLVVGIAGFVLMNVTFRAFRVTLAWADELAILSMTLAAFVGASLMLRARSDPAVLLVHEVVGPGVRRALRVLVSALAAGFGGLLFWMCWRWFNLPALIAAGFDVRAFEAATFNFIYSEVTPVMRLRAHWFYLVMPWFALTITVHALTNLAEDLGLVEPPAPGPGIASGEG
jgi:TRAP-type C4-dicarboxylate transport system permease small subunit